jgi:hypothetical protein
VLVVLVAKENGHQEGGFRLRNPLDLLADLLVPLGSH